MRLVSRFARSSFNEQDHQIALATALGKDVPLPKGSV